MDLKWRGGVAALRREMSSQEWGEWRTYYRREAQRAELEHLRAQARAGKA